MASNTSGLKPPWPKGTSGFKGHHWPKKAAEERDRANEARMTSLEKGMAAMLAGLQQLTGKVDALIDGNAKPQSQSQPRSEVPPSPEPVSPDPRTLMPDSARIHSREYLQSGGQSCEISDARVMAEAKRVGMNTFNSKTAMADACRKQLRKRYPDEGTKPSRLTRWNLP